MNYFHYTNIEAFSSIVKDNPIKNKEICFWATRFDCFSDKTEYRYGIAKIYPVLYDFEIQSGIQDDRKIAPFFDPTEVERAISVLKRVYVKNNKQKSVVEAILNQKGYKHIPVETLA